MAFVQLQNPNDNLFPNVENDTGIIFFFFFTSFLTHFLQRRVSGFVRGAGRRQIHDGHTVPCYGCVYVNNWKILCFLDWT